MKKIKFLCGMVALLSIYACKKDQYYLFNDVARLQFGPAITDIYIPAASLRDTLKPFTFFYDNASVTMDTVFFDIYAIGGITKEDRPFTLEQVQVPNVTNAQPGKHYVAFNDPTATKNFIIKAGTIHTKVPILLLRDPSLKTTTCILKFKVIANKDFQTGEINNLWRKIEFTDRVSKPAAWDASATNNYFGVYSVVKHEFMIQNTGEKWDQEFMAALPSNFALRQYWAGMVKIKLVDYNNAHPGNPLRDENGLLVIFP